MKLRLLIGALGLLCYGAQGCKQRDTDASTKSALPGLGDYFVMKADMGQRRLVFYEADPKTHEPIKPLKEAFFYQVQGFIGGPLKIDGFNTPLAANGEVDYGWLSDPLWTCDDARRLVHEAPSATPSQEKCLIELNTEDQNWYTVSVFNMDVNGQPIVKYNTDTTLANLPRGKRLITDGPLRPGSDLNVEADPKVLEAMIAFDRKYQNSNQMKTARNTCLKNGRAYSWLDLQAHFYCMMPYSPERSCYSTNLVTKSAALNSVTDPKLKIAGLVQIYNESFEDCFGKAGKSPMSDEDAAVFKYVMFTKQGVMDFNIESENAIIEKFYKTKDKPETRPRRVVDSVPAWVANQPRYDDIRLQQRSFMEKLLLQAGAAAAAAQAWWKMKPPTQADIDALLAKGINQDANPYADYRKEAVAKDEKDRMDLPGTAILQAMILSGDTYNLAGTHSCLQMSDKQNHWSDIMLHYYCVFGEARHCYSNEEAAVATPDARKTAFTKCSKDKNYGEKGFAFVMDTQPDIFQYIMFSAPNAFKEQQQQDIINKFWGVNNPADAAECTAKRPRRANDPTDGTHCLATKKRNPELQGIGK